MNIARRLGAFSPQAMELMHVLSASRWEVFWKLRLPTSLPFLFSAVKVATSTAVVGAIVGEWIGSQEGIGALIIQATYNFDSALLYAVVLCGSAFSVAFFMAIRLLERLVVRWDAPGGAMMRSGGWKERPGLRSGPAGAVGPRPRHLRNGLVGGRGINSPTSSIVSYLQTIENNFSSEV